MHAQSGDMDAARTSDSHDLRLTPTSAEAGPRGAGISSGEKDSAALNDEADEALHTSSRRRKPPSFYMAFLCLLVMVFLCSMDSTIMAVSIPVSHLQPNHLKTSECS